jgi:hypothetical protein
MSMYLTTTESRKANLPSTDDQIAAHNARARFARLSIGSRVMIAGAAWDGFSVLGPSNPIECTVEIVEADHVFVKPLPGYFLSRAWATAGQLLEVL